MTGKARRREWGSVRRLPSGRYQARFRHPITGIEHTATDTFARRAEAARYLATAEADLERGSWRDPRLGRVTFAAWYDQYRAAAVHKRPTTRSTHDHIAKNHLLPTFGPMPLAAVTPSDVQRFVQALVAKGLAPSTVRTAYGLLRSIFSAAVAQDVLATSPCRGIKQPTKSQQRGRVLTSEELQRLGDAMASPFRPMVYLGGVLGMRWSEIAGLRVKRLNLLRRTLLVAETVAQVGGFADVKTEASRRTLSLPPFLAEMLAKHLALRGLGGADGEELVFVGPRGGPLVYTNWHKRYWAPAVVAARVEGFRFHGLRHTSVALMVDVGVHPKAIQERLGHSSFATTMDVYGHLLASTDDHVTDQLQAIFGSADGTSMARHRGSASGTRL